MNPPVIVGVSGSSGKELGEDGVVVSGNSDCSWINH